MEANNTAIFVISGVGLIAGLFILMLHLLDKNLHKNPYNLLLMGIIIVDEIMVIHLVFSVMGISKRNLVGCQLVGLIGVFATFAGAAYNFYLSELILSVSKVFNPKDLSHLKYHFYAIMTGLFFSLFSIVLEDIGITCFGNCGTARGSILEFLYVTIIVFVWPYCIFSAVKCIIKIKKDKSALGDQKQLYKCHIFNIVIFTITWMPMIFLHFLDYALKLDFSKSHYIQDVSLTIAASTPLFHTISRILCDKQLMNKCLRKKQVTQQDQQDLIDNLLDRDKRGQNKNLQLKNPNRASMRPIYERLTQTETLNNLLSTFSGICMLMDDVYDNYFQNQFLSDLVDSLSSNNMVNEEIARKKISKLYCLDSLTQRYNSQGQYSFPDDLKKNISNDLNFEITEYAFLIFQNIRSLHSMKQEMFRDSLLPFNNTKTLTKSFEKTSAKGGKPLIKTHDKRFLIKEVKKEEKDFFMSILPKYHMHLKKNPKSILAKIVGIYSIRIGNKDKVYQVLMESLDPIEETLIKFKYDLKFSTVNRREFKRKQEVKVVQAELLEQDPLITELFPSQRALTSLKDIDKGLGLNQFGSSNSSDNKSREAKVKKNKKANNVRTDSSDSNQKDAKKGKQRASSSPDPYMQTDYDEDDEDSDEREMLADDEDFDDDDIENDEKFKQLDYEEQLVFREQKYLYRQQRMWTNDQKINLKDNPQLKQQLMSKLGLLKDSDFKCMHDRKLPVSPDNADTIVEFLQTIERDVRFLEGLRIMDYSLFLIILQAPKVDDVSLLGSSDNNIGIQGNSGGSSYIKFSGSRSADKNEEAQNTIDELVRNNRFVMYSPSKNYVYLMGLIDYLGRWNLNKKSEMYGKTFLAHFIRQNTDFSVKPPHEFARRFLRKVKRIFKVKPNKEKNGDIFADMMLSRHNLFLAQQQFNAVEGNGVGELVEELKEE